MAKQVDNNVVKINSDITIVDNGNNELIKVRLISKDRYFVSLGDQDFEMHLCRCDWPASELIVRKINA